MALEKSKGTRSYFKSHLIKHPKPAKIECNYCKLMKIRDEMFSKEICWKCRNIGEKIIVRLFRLTGKWNNYEDVKSMIIKMGE